LLLIIMDGVGLGRPDDSNAVHVANPPVLNGLFKAPLFARLRAHGPAVGLPSESDMGNSEVGHNALGAGRVFDQGAKLVNAAIAEERVFRTEIWEKLLACGRSHTLHFIGLLSDGNVHSHIDQLFALLRRAAKEGAKKIRLHVLADGRDVGEKTVLTYLARTEELLAELRSGGCDAAIGSGGGRMKVTMDRYFADWSVVERGWKAHVLGEGRKFQSAAEAVETYYREDPKMTDQYLDSFVVADAAGKPIGPVTDGDGVVFFNFRGDRAIEISMAFEQEDFGHFDRKRRPKVVYAGMMEYDGDTHVPRNFLVNPPEIERTLSQYLCAEGVRSFAVAETQKYGHVTYFWNGNRSGYIDPALETYVEIPSDRIEFDKAPAMKAREVTAKAIELLNSGKTRFGRVNLANGDMVGHTGNFSAAVEAVRVVDECVGRMLEENRKLGGVTVVTADHGNCDEMWTIEKGKKSVKTAHTLNPVPFVIDDPGFAGEYGIAEVANPGLANVAATICNLLGFEPPADYEPSLVRVSEEGQRNGSSSVWS
jgi:2,3-bisphosphoglycerate-independent phosphoglycerate mutase